MRRSTTSALNVVCLVTSPPQAAVVSWEFSHNQEGKLMSTSTLSLEALHRKIEAVEGALTFAIASISLHIPAVRQDVIGGLKLNAARPDNPESVKAALLELAKLIDRVKAVSPDEFQKNQK